MQAKESLRLKVGDVCPICGMGSLDIEVYDVPEEQRKHLYLECDYCEYSVEVLDV